MPFTTPLNTRSRQLVRDLETCLERLISAAAAGEHHADLFGETQTLVAALPMSTHEYGTTRCRVENAQRYLQYNEPGAAIYELRMVLGGMRSLTQRLA